jgi:hypothetical protein
VRLDSCRRLRQTNIEISKVNYQCPSICTSFARAKYVCIANGSSLASHCIASLRYIVNMGSNDKHKIAALEENIVAMINEQFGTWVCNGCKRRYKLGEKCPRYQCRNAGLVGMCWVEVRTTADNRDLMITGP